MQVKDILKLIRKHENMVKRLDMIAQDEGTPCSVLERLSRLTESQVTTSIMLNPSTPSRVLERELKLRSGVGGTDEEARIHISYNPSLRMKILKQLETSDSAPAVKSAARRALKLRIKTLSSK